MKLSGIKYQLGSNEKTEPATVVIQGKVRTNLKGERIFDGEVEIVGEEIPVPQEDRNTKIRFSKNGWGAITYFYIDYNNKVPEPEIYQSHSLFANKDFSQVTLLIHKSKESNAEDGSGWNSGNGLMLSAPASTREEALMLSNTLMLKFLGGIILY